MPCPNNDILAGLALGMTLANRIELQLVNPSPDDAEAIILTLEPEQAMKLGALLQDMAVRAMRRRARAN